MLTLMPLLSKTEKGVEPFRGVGYGCIAKRTVAQPTRKAQRESIMQYVQPATQVDPAHRVREPGQADQGAVPQQGVSSWSQLVAMMFCQLGRAHSLREIEGGLESCEGKLSHLGIEAPARSSLAYANAHRPWELFEQVFHGLYGKVAASASGS